jgi:hypothetical protein
MYIRNTLQHRTGPIPIEKPVRRSSEGGMRGARLNY